MDDHYSKELSLPPKRSKVSLKPPLVQSFLKKLGKQFREQEDSTVPPGISVRKYLLSSVDRTFLCYCIEPEDIKERLPAILYLHGGVFPLSDRSTMINNAVFYAEKIHCRVFLLEYHLPLIDPFPAGLEESYTALRFILDFHERLKVDPERIILYGDNLGGTLAASLTRYYLDQHTAPALAGLALVYPALDNSLDYFSKKQYEKAAWPITANRKMWHLYLPQHLRNHPLIRYAVPAKNRDFTDFPPVYIECMEKDILRDEALKYERELRKAGAVTFCHFVKGAYHGYDHDQESMFVQRMLKKRVKILGTFISTR